MAGQGDRHDVFVVARNIRALRLRDGLTQGELAARLGVLPAQVSPDVIRGIGCPGADLSGRSSAAVRIVDSVTRGDDGVECHASGEVGPVPTELAGRHPSAFLFRVGDDSMSLLFVRNALVLIDPDVSLPRGSHVGLVAPNGGPAAIRRVLVSPAGVSITAEPAAGDPTRELVRPGHPDDVGWVGLAVWDTTLFEREY